MSPTDRLVGQEDWIDNEGAFVLAVTFRVSPTSDPVTLVSTNTVAEGSVATCLNPK